jgi:hypothetical protein
MSGRLQQLSEGQANPEVPINENSDTLEHQAIYGKNPDTSTGLTWGLYGGRWGGFEISNGTVTLTGEGSPTPTNYIVVNRSTGVASVSTNATNWNNVGQYARAWKVYTNASAVLSTPAPEDHRVGAYGVHGSAEGIIWNEQSDSYTLALTDAGHAVAMNKATSNTLTLPAMTTVAYPIGKATVIRQKGAGATTVSPAANVTLSYRASGSPSFSQLAGQNAIAVVMKVDTDEWVLTGDLV